MSIMNFRKMFFHFKLIQYCARIRNTNFPQKILVVPYTCELSLIGANSIILPKIFLHNNSGSDNLRSFKADKRSWIFTLSPNWHITQLALSLTGTFRKFFCDIENLSPRRKKKVYKIFWLKIIICKKISPLYVCSKFSIKKWLSLIRAQYCINDIFSNGYHF